MGIRQNVQLKKHVRNMVQVDDIISIIEKIAPRRLAEEWDNVGLQVGQTDWPVKKIRIALDPSYPVAADACQDRVDLLIVHHPLIFKPLASVDFNAPVGRVIRLAAENRLAIVAAHTNMDSAAGGLNDMLAQRIGLNNIRMLVKTGNPDDDQSGLGRVGDLGDTVDFKAFVADLKKRMNIKEAKATGKADLEVCTVAVCTGSGSGLLPQFLTSGAQVYVSGDLHYHDAKTVEAVGLGLVDIGHFASERLFVDLLANKLRAVLCRKHPDVELETDVLEKDPFEIV